MHKTFSSVLLVLGLLFFSACQNRQLCISHDIGGDCDYYSLQTAQCLDQKQLIKKLEPYPVIFIGDHHSQVDLHKNIANLIASLSQQGFKVHLANEWFYPDNAKILSSFVNNDINETEFLEQIQWNKRHKFDSYESFKPIYEAAKKNKGNLYGINLSKVEQKNISEQNLTAMGTDELSFATSLDLEVGPHKEFVMPYLDHCHAPKKNETLSECTKRMYRVQVAWDSKMALESNKLASNLLKNEKLLVFAGSMHIENNLGIPLRFARLSNLPSLTIIPRNRQTKEVTHGLGDYLLFYQENEASK